MKRYVQYLQTTAKDNIISHGLGDWFDLGPNRPGEAQLTPKAVTATSIYYYDLQIITKVAEMLGFNEDVKEFGNLSAAVKQAFLNNFYDEKTGVCATGSQTSYAMSLYTGLIPEQDKVKVLQNLVDSIAKNDFALTSGDIGYHFLVRVLSESGRSDILYKMNNRSDRPGYGYQLKQGATALTESWAALKNVSNNHMMLGHLMEWFYAGLGGIYQAEHSVAYSEIIIAPKPVGNIKWVKCSFLSPKGLVQSDWEIGNGSFVMKIEIPENTTAKIILPDEFINSNLKVVNQKNQKPVNVKIENGQFSTRTGKFEISAVQ